MSDDLHLTRDGGDIVIDSGQQPRPTTIDPRIAYFLEPLFTGFAEPPGMALLAMWKADNLVAIVPLTGPPYHPALQQGIRETLAEFEIDAMVFLCEMWLWGAKESAFLPGETMEQAVARLRAGRSVSQMPDATEGILALVVPRDGMVQIATMAQPHGQGADPYRYRGQLIRTGDANFAGRLPALFASFFERPGDRPRQPS